MKRKKKSRIKEPSTWSAAAALMASAAQLPIPGILPWCLGISGIMASIGMYLREGGEEAAQSVEVKEAEQ